MPVVFLSATLLDCTVADGLIIAGDAARVVDPLTGGGIYNGMYTGRLAAEVAAECIEKCDVSKTALMKYDKTWRASKMGKAIERNYHIKEYLIRQPDTKLNEIIHSVSKLNLTRFYHAVPDKRNYPGEPETDARAGGARCINPMIF